MHFTVSGYVKINFLNMKTKCSPFLIYLTLLFTFAVFVTSGQEADELKLKDYRPVSIYKIPETKVNKAKYPVIDMHTHVYARNTEEIEQWIKAMDNCGIEKSIVLTGATGSGFDDLVKLYANYTDRFELWCGFDYSGYNEPGFGPAAVKELERCVASGARGVGEAMYKGKVNPGNPSDKIRLPDDPEMDPLFEKCAELKIPVNIHISEDAWMYEEIDSNNDGLMNAAKWHIDVKSGSKSHEEMLQSFENTVKKHPKTIFIAAHLLNCCADLNYLGNMFDKYPNLYADISARFGEIAPIPKFVNQFFEKYQDRIVYGTDYNFNEKRYRATFRILETADEHFYENFMFGYHWPLYGFALSENVLKKLYESNAEKIINH